MDSEELYATYVKALNIVSKASVIVLEGFNKRKKVETKAAAHDLVTEYDKQVEAFIKEQLNHNFPKHRFLGEETSNSRSVPDDLTWILDPIDGTNNFVHSCPESAISLALTLNKEPLIGIVCCPMLQKLYSACKGRGSFLNGTPIHTSPATNLSESLIGLEISLGAKSKLLLDRLGKRNLVSVTNSHGVRSIGSAAVGLAYVAQGMWEVYHTEGLQPWDVAAGVILVREAGGYVLDSLGEKFDLENSNILAANGENMAKRVAQMFKSVE